MKNIVWLCSWYPNDVDKFRGDFVQRQAIATSQFCNINVIHIVFCDFDKEVSIQVNENLTEHIFYIKKKNQVANLCNYFLIHQKIKKTIHLKIDLTHVQVPMNAGIVALFWKLIYKIPYVITEHYGIYNRILPENYFNRTIAYKAVLKQIIKNATKLFSVSQFIADEMNKALIEKKIVVIPNVVDADYFRWIPKNENKKFRFIHVSSLTFNKNIDGILDAFAKLFSQNQQIEFVIIGGDETENTRIKNQYSSIKNAIQLKGVLPYHQIASELQQSDCAVLNSDIENSPCIIIESLCCGIPVISTNVGGVPELVDETNSILIEKRNVKALCQAMQKMIESAHSFDEKNISNTAINRFGYASIGSLISKNYDLI